MRGAAQMKEGAVREGGGGVIDDRKGEGAGGWVYRALEVSVVGRVLIVDWHLG